MSWRWHERGWTWWLVGMLVALGMGIATPVHGQGIAVRWEKPIRLSDPNQMAWFPDVAASDDGTVVVVWSGGVQRGKAAFDTLVLTKRQGDFWSRPVDVQAALIIQGMSFVTRNSILIDRYGDLLATFRVPTTLFFSRVPLPQATLASAWASPYRLSGSNVAYYNELAVDPYGRLHVVWSEITITEKSCEGCSEIYYRSSDNDGETWTAPKDLSQSPGYDSLKPHIWVARDGWVYVTWQEGKGLSGWERKPFGIGLTRSPDRGRTWLGPVLITATVGSPQQGVLGEDGQGALILIWRTAETETVYFQRSTDHGESWSSPMPLPGFRARPWAQIPYDDYDLARDSLGRLHFVGVGAVGGEGQVGVWHMMWDGTTWHGPFLVSANRNFPEWPRLAVSEGRQLHLVWFERDPENMYNSDAGRYTVWYSTALTDAPLARRTPMPRPAPTPTPTRWIPLTPSPTSWIPQVTDLPALPPGQPRPDADATRLILWIGGGVGVISLFGWWVRRRMD